MGNPIARWDMSDKLILGVFLFILIIGLGLFFGVYLRQQDISSGTTELEFVIGPTCGPVPTGQIEDMITDEGACRNRCRARCAASSLLFKESSIRIDDATGCNICDCVCR